MANRRKEKPLRRVTVSVDPDDYAALEALTENGDVTTAWLIRRAMREFLERHDDVRKLEVPLRQKGQRNNKQVASE